MGKIKKKDATFSTLPIGRASDGNAVAILAALLSKPSNKWRRF